MSSPRVQTRIPIALKEALNGESCNDTGNNAGWAKCIMFAAAYVGVQDCPISKRVVMLAAQHQDQAISVYAAAIKDNFAPFELHHRLLEIKGISPGAELSQLDVSGIINLLLQLGCRSLGEGELRRILDDLAS